MPFDELLAQRIRHILANEGDFSERKMFGGIAFMLGDMMCCGVLEDMLVARIGPERGQMALKKPHVKPMDFTGRPLKGYVYVTAPAIKKNTALTKWLQEAIAFVSTLTDDRKHRSKRKTVSQIESRETARATPLSKLVNFGPVTLPEFKSMGISTFGQLEDLGWEAVCRKWVEHFPERLNANAFIGVIATLEGISWTKVSASDKARAKRLVNEIRLEYGLPSARPARSKRRT